MFHCSAEIKADLAYTTELNYETKTLRAHVALGQFVNGRAEAGVVAL